MTAGKYRTFVDLVRDRAQQSPEHTIYTFLERGVKEIGSLNYGELDRNARATGVRLIEQGYKGKSVLLVFQPGLDFITGFLGCLYAGAKAVPAHPPTRRHLDRLKAIVEDAKAEIILTNSAFEVVIRNWMESGEFNIQGDIELLAVDVIGSTDADLWRDTGVSPDDLAFLQYTSGSTGQPKGVMVTHDNLMHNAGLIIEGKVINEQTVNVTWLPQFHDMGLIDGILTPLYSGRPNYMMSPATFSRNPLNWLKAIDKYRGTHSGGPCFAYEYCTRLVSEEEKDTLDLSSWTFAYSAAEPIRKSVMDNFSKAFHRCGFRSKHIVPAYGMAETTLIVTGNRNEFKSLRLDAESLQNNQVKLVESGSNHSTEIVSCGPILTLLNESADDSNQVVIVNPGSKCMLADGAVGEIWIKGRSVSKGYWNKPELTQDVFNACIYGSDGKPDGPYLRTGDLGFLHDDQLYVTGRIKDVIIIRGANFYPQDIEYAVSSNDKLLNENGCAVFTIGQQNSLVIVQELAARVPVEKIHDIEQKIKERVAEALGLVVYDVALIKFGSIDKTSSGKIQRYKVRENYLANNLTRFRAETGNAENHSPGVFSNMERNHVPDFVPDPKLLRKIKNTLVFWIAEKCELNIADIDENRNFAAMGIDSISVVEMVVNLERAAEVTIAEDALHKYQTINELANYVVNAKNPANTISVSKSKPGIKRKPITSAEKENIVFPVLEVL